GLVDVAPLERSASRVCELSGELEVVVGEAVLVREEHEDHTALLVSGRLERHGEQGLAARAACERLPLLTEALVIRQKRRGDHPGLVRAEVEEARRVRQALVEPGRERGWKRERARELEVSPTARHQHRREVSAQCLGGGLRRGVERRRE